MKRAARTLAVVLGCLALTTVLSSTTSGAQTSPPGCHPPSLKDCYTYGTMQSYVDTILPMVVQFFDTQYTNLPHPVAYIYVARGYTDDEQCVDQQGNNFVADSTAYEYCPADHKVYVGQDMLWALYHQAGDAAPAVGLAHEFGHNVQYYASVPPPRTNKAHVRYENQADCVAGAWLKYAEEQGWLEQEDVGTIVKFVKLIASAETESRDHGDLVERASSLRQGLDSGLSSCNSFYPTHPIVT